MNLFYVFIFQRHKQNSRRLICSVATESVPDNAEESKMDAPKEIFLKDYTKPDYYFETVCYPSLNSKLSI